MTKGQAECDTIGEKLQMKTKLQERDINSQSMLQMWPKLHEKQPTDTGS